MVFCQLEIKRLSGCESRRISLLTSQNRYKLQSDGAAIQGKLTFTDVVRSVHIDGFLGRHNDGHELLQMLLSACAVCDRIFEDTHSSHPSIPPPLNI